MNWVDQVDITNIIGSSDSSDIEAAFRVRTLRPRNCLMD